MHARCYAQHSMLLVALGQTANILQRLLHIQMHGA